MCFYESVFNGLAKVKTNLHATSLELFLIIRRWNFFKNCFNRLIKNSPNEIAFRLIFVSRETYQSVTNTLINDGLI